MYLVRTHHTPSLHIRLREPRLRAAHLAHRRGYPGWNLLLDLVEIVVDPIRLESSHAPIVDTLGSGRANEFGAWSVGVGA